MGLKIMSDDKGTKIYRKDKTSSAGNPYSTFSIMVSSKNQDGSFTNGFVDVLFKKADAEKITNKCVINIKNAFPTVSEYNGVKTIKYFILDFDVLHEGEKPAPSFEQNLSNDTSFMDIPDGIADELPFH